MRSSKGSHKIIVQDCEYRWRARGDDGCIVVYIWPSNNIGALIVDSCKYHETWIDNGDGSHSSAGDQVIITNRIVRQMIECAILHHAYNPNVTARDLKLKSLDYGISLEDAIRATRKRPQLSKDTP